MPAVTISTLGAFVFGVFLLYIVAKLITLPVRIIYRLCVSAILGGIMLFVVNYAGSFIDFHIPLNPITAIIAGVLGIPGVILLAVVELFVL